MPIRRGLKAPQNVFIEAIIKKFDGPGRCFILGNATVPDCPIVFCSDGFCKLYGFTRAELMQKSCCCKFLQGEQTDHITINSLSKFLTEPHEQRIDAVFYTRNDIPITVSVLVAPIVNDVDKIVMYIINHEELTENTKLKKSRKVSRIKRFSSRKHNSSTNDGKDIELKRQRSDLAASSLIKNNQLSMNHRSNHSEKSKKSVAKIPKVKISGKSVSDGSIGYPDHEQSSQHFIEDRDLVHITDVSEKLDCASTSTFNADDTCQVDNKDNATSTLVEECRRNDSASVDDVSCRRPLSRSDSRTSFINNRLNNLRRSISDVKRGKDAEIISALDEMNVKPSDVNSTEKSNKGFSTVRRSALPQYKLEEIYIPKFTLVHYSLFKAFWDWLILIIVLYTAIMTPFAASFLLTRDAQRAMLDRNPETRVNHAIDDPYNDPLFVIDWIVDITFIVDILINFRTTYVDSNDEIVTEWKKIALHYLKSWFVIDVIAAIPFELFIGGEQNDQTITLIGLLKTARLLRVIRVVRKADRYSETGAAILILLMFAFALIAHWLACIWYAIGIAERPNLPNPKYSWLDKLSEEIHRPINKTLGDSGPTIVDRYLTALYFTFSSLTTVGFGNVSATTKAEKVFAILVMWLGSLMYASIFGNVTAIIQRLYASTARYHAHLKKIREFIKFHKIPYPLKDRLAEYFQHTWSFHKGIDMTSVLKSFPESLQADISLHLNRNLLENSKIFATSSPSCIRSLAFKIQSTHCPPGDYLIMQGDKLNALYFVSRGSVEVLRNDVVVAILGVGDTFGENFYVHREIIKSNANVRALTYCDLHTIGRESLLEVLDAYTDFAEHFSRELEITYNLREKRTTVEDEKDDPDINTVPQQPRERTRSCAVTLSARSLEHLYSKTNNADKTKFRGRSSSSSLATRVSKSYLSPTDTTNTVFKPLARAHSNHDDIAYKDIYRTDLQSKTDLALDNHKISSSAETASLCSHNKDTSSNVLDGCNMEHSENPPFPMEELKGHVSVLSKRIDVLEKRLTNDIKTILLLLQEKAAQHDSATKLIMAEPLAERNSPV